EERTETEEARLPPPEEAAPPEAPVPRPRERPPVPRRGIEPDPDQLIGLSQAETEALLGVPKWKEEAAPAEVWHYASGNCTLKVFFYLDLASSTYRALVYEVKDHDESDHAKRLCFAQIL
ncbi:MAG: hypothetical protein GWO02_07340, partial [Gammaproteobacteria bacterium]|nr:hypothetical protein [Gammaproteobacteria bacterium]